MKKIVLACLSLLVTFTAGAVTTDDATVLRIDSVRVVGNMMDMMTQHILIDGRNISDKDFNGMIHLVQDLGDGQRKGWNAWPVAVKAGECMSVVVDEELPEGDYQFYISADRDGNKLLSESFHITIGPLRPLKFKTEFQIDMMSVVDGENVLSGNYLQGRITITNVDDVPYYGVSKASSWGLGLDYRFKDYDNNVLSFMRPIWPGNNQYPDLEPNESITSEISVDYDFEEGNHYALITHYTVYGRNLPIDSLLFTYHAGTKTYWTAEGAVKPMPLADDRVLKVPSEAVAVDLRGLYYMGSVYTLDISEANPNCLYYLDFLDDVPRGLNDDCNVVRDGQASTIRLTDDHDFYCPKAFKAKYISYTLKPSHVAGDVYAETLVLPFSPQGASLLALNYDDPHSELLKIFRYEGFYGDTLSIITKTVDQMDFYKPYIVAVGADTPVCFYAENVTVPVTVPAVAYGGDIDFVGGTVFQAPTASTYRFLPKYSVFVAAGSDYRIPPFRACLNVTKPSTFYEYLRVNLGFQYEPDDEPGEWGGGYGSPDDAGEDLDDNENQAGVVEVGYTSAPAAVHTLGGTQVRASGIGSLKPGLYIIGNRKVLVP